MTTMLLTFSVARTASLEEFGLFSMVIPVWLVVQRALRVYLLIPRQIAMHEGEGPFAEHTPILAATMCSLGIAIPLMLAGLLLGGQIGPWLAVLAAGLPGILVFDALRNEIVSRHKAHVALMMDSIWLVAQALTVLVLSLTHPHPIALFCAWLTPPLLICVAHASTRSSSWGTRLQARAQMRLGAKSVSDVITDLINSVLIVQALPYLIAGQSGLAAAGHLRGALTLVGPINIVVMGTLPLLQMSVARNSTRNSRVAHETDSLTVILMSIALAFTVALLLIPEDLGMLLLGEVWHGTSLIILAIGLQTVLRTPIMTATTAMRSTGLHKSLALHRLLSGLLLLAGAGIGGSLGELAGAAWGMVVATVLSATWGRISLGRQLADRMAAR